MFKSDLFQRFHKHSLTIFIASNVGVGRDVLFPLTIVCVCAAIHTTAFNQGPKAGHRPTLRSYVIRGNFLWITQCCRTIAAFPSNSQRVDAAYSLPR